MALTESSMLALGTQAPPFRLPDPSGRTVALEDLAGAPALVVAFLCNHCPYVKHLKSELGAFSREMHERGVAMVGINANDAEAYPDDAPERMAGDAERFGYAFPYLFDASQEVARAYRAECTPEFYLFDADRRLVYRGRFDASRPGNDLPVTGDDLRAAVDALLAGRPVDAEQQPSIGCNIKWKG